MPMTHTDFVMQLNRLVNRGLANVGNAIGSGAAITTTTISADLTAAATAVTALTGSAATHSRAMADPGPALNPHQPRTAQ